MSSSGVRWGARYRYFTKGWVNNWGFSGYDGSWGLSYLRECDSGGFIPAVQYYQMNGEAGGGESAFLQKVQNAGTMRSYFGDFKLLMQRAKDFGKPVIVLVEADGFGFLEQQTGGNSAAYAAIKDSGVAELAGLPNTVAGWGLAFLQLRRSVGANNVILGIHLSAWASGKDIAYGAVSDPLGPEVDKVYNFLAPFGLAANVTGATWDLLVGDPSDRDADYYALVQGQSRWWDASDSASVSAKSFNRYAEWLRLWNAKASKRWILWQIPLGNSNHRNVANDGSARAGYKDNRPEYFFGNGTAHLAKFADVGVIGLLFGAGAGGQSSYQNDNYTDGALFMKSRAGAIVNAGGVTLASGTHPAGDGQRRHHGNHRGRRYHGRGRHQLGQRGWRAVQLRIERPRLDDLRRALYHGRQLPRARLRGNEVARHRCRRHRQRHRHGVLAHGGGRRGRDVPRLDSGGQRRGLRAAVRAAGRGGELGLDRELARDLVPAHQRLEHHPGDRAGECRASRPARTGSDDRQQLDRHIYLDSVGP